MDVCAGSRLKGHAEIAHTEGSSSCPLCDKIVECDGQEKEIETLKAQKEFHEGEADAYKKLYEDLQKKTEGFAWVLEDVAPAPEVT